MSQMWTGSALAPVLAAWLATSVLQALAGLIHRSGSIRLGQWADEAGGRIHELHSRPHAFEAFRHVFSMLSQVSALVLCVTLIRWLEPASGAWIASWAGGLGLAALLVGCNDIAVRWLVARRSEGALERLTPIYHIAALVFSVWIFVLSRVMPSATHTRESEEDEVPEGKLDAFIEVGQREGILEGAEGELVRGVVEFAETQVRSVMTPRVDVVCAAADAEVKEVVRLAVEHNLSRIPVFQESIDHIVGVVHIRDLLRVLFTGEEAKLTDFALPPHFVPQSKRLAELLKELQERHQALAIVVDEYGGTEGIVTLEDILEEIFGEIVDEHDSADGVPEQREDGSWSVGGQVHIEELDELFDVRIEEAPYETVSGLIFGELGRVPEVGDVVRAHGLELTVESIEARRVHTARVRPLVAEGSDVAARE